MSEPLNVQVILRQAREQEREYNWLRASESYKKALGLVSEKDFLKIAEIYELLGYVFYRGAMQAESVNEFREGMREAVANYGKAKEFYERISEPLKTSRTLRCDAMIAYVGYWLASEVSEKKRLLDECWQRTKEALKAFEKTGDALECGKTYNQLSSSAHGTYFFEWSFQAREKLIRDAMEYGERAITLLSSVGDSHELARVYVKGAIYLTTFSYYFVSDMDEKERCHQKSLDYWQKAIELSEEAALLEVLSIPGGSPDWNVDEMLVHYEKALDCAKKTKDKYLIGTALDWLAYAASWKSMGIEDPDKRVESQEKALQYAEDAKHQFSSISFISPRGAAFWVGGPNADYYSLVGYWETNLKKKRDILEKAIIEGTHEVKLAESTGYPDIIMYIHHTVSRAPLFLAQIETNTEEKKKLLEKALEHAKEYMKLADQFEPFAYWDLGVGWNRLADIKAELSNVEKDLETRKNMLEEAVSNRDRGLQLCTKYCTYFEKIGELSMFSNLGWFQHTYGEMLNRLYRLTNNNEHLRRAIKAFQEAAESYQKLNLTSWMAECYWKAARGYDALGEHLKAAENFNTASNNYTSATEKIPQLRGFYQDHALYMQAWSEIEKAKHHHARQEYDMAKEHYEKASTMHKSLKQWSYLAPNYSAWAQVENAEDLSRREKSEEALQAFEEAAKLFSETKKSLETKLREIENLDEKTMATNLIKASDMRREYCLGRMALEEAKILDKKGDHYSSSQKYDSAAQTFEKITRELESEQDRKEFNLIISLSRAWQKMMMAEAKASSTMYGEAAELFKQAKEYTLDQPTSLLALANSSFCKALEAGTEFEITRDTAIFSTAKKHMEAAANYYLKAGYKNASEYARATELLFDAYMHMDNAKKETDPEKKARLYIMTEKVLQVSAGSFMKAEHPEKMEQVSRMLEKVKEERELAVSLSEVLHAPTIVSATTTFSTPTPTHENAVGLERFEHADIQANVIIRQKELKIGENLGLEIELVNAGKGPAILIKLTEVIPEGFEVTEKPETYRVEDSYVNMKGKRLDPLKTEEVNLVLKPKVQGEFQLKPRILYLDENGKYKSHQPEPINITVKELGIKGWLKGER